MSRYNKSLRLNETDKRVLQIARTLPQCAALFEVGGLGGIAPRDVGLMVYAITAELNAPLDDVCHGLAKLSASGRFVQ